MSIIILEPTNEADATPLLNLAHRLGVKATVSQELTISAEERERRFLALFGAWKSDETGDELNQMLRESRHFNRPDVEL